MPSMRGTYNGSSWWKRLLAWCFGGQTCGHGKPLTPQEDLTIAHRAASDGDLPHAAHHLGCVLLDNPQHSGALMLLNRLIERSDDPLALAPVGKKEVFAGTGAVRSYVLARLGRFQEAIELLLGLDRHCPQKKFWRWGLEWMCQDNAAVKVAAPQAAALLAAVAFRHIGDTVAEPAALAEVQSAIPAAQALAMVHQTDGWVQGMYSALLRKAGRFDEALDIARRAHAVQPTYISAIALALAHKMKGNTDDAVAAYEQCIELKPEAAADHHVHIAELLYEASRPDEAAARANIALQINPEHPAGLPLHYHLRWQFHNDAEARDRLFELAKQSPDGPVARYANIGQPFVDYLPSPQEATVNVGRQFAAEKQKGKAVGVTRLGLSSLEDPSSRTAVEMALEMPLGSLPVEVAEVPDPDPRSPRAPVKHLLWTYNGTQPCPALPAPAPEVAQRVASLARRPFNLAAWAREARSIAGDLGSSAIPDLLATMVHPSPPADGVPAWDWVFAQQIAAAMIIAKSGMAWEQSSRRDALLSLALGPVDWTTTTAIVAMTHVHLAEENAVARSEIEQVFHSLLERVPSPGYCSYLRPLLLHLLRLPSLSAEERAVWEGLLRDLDQGQ